MKRFIHMTIQRCAFSLYTLKKHLLKSYVYDTQLYNFNSRISVCEVCFKIYSITELKRKICELIMKVHWSVAPYERKNLVIL